MFNRFNRRRKESQLTVDDSATSIDEENVAAASTSHNAGFICPDCLQSFITAEGLQGHFEEAHLAPPAPASPPPALEQHQSTADSLPPEVLALVCSMHLFFLPF
ncbi:uncharacterized protein LOC135810766 [Sycon ciliatum]|uniref:uncharacterized protein LOC135810766 n=1 Tax=Sycon ciliatum TaxID=27933 RepID=UPI0031F67C48